MKTRIVGLDLGGLGADDSADFGVGDVAQEKQCALHPSEFAEGSIEEAFPAVTSQLAQQHRQHDPPCLDLGRPSIPKRVIGEIEELAANSNLSIRQIQSKIAGRASRRIVGEITKRARAAQPVAL